MRIAKPIAAAFCLAVVAAAAGAATPGGQAGRQNGPVANAARIAGPDRAGCPRVTSGTEYRPGHCSVKR